MKKQTRIIYVGLIVAILVATAAIVLWKRHTASSQTATGQPVRPAAVMAVPESSTPTSDVAPRSDDDAQANAVVPTTPPVETLVSEDGGKPAKAVRVRSTQTLASVNGVQITLRDLVPVREGDANAEQVMSPEMYEFLLNRAIERELTVQAARAQGVELSEEQQRQLKQMQAQLQAAAKDPAVVWRPEPIDATKVEFEIRDAAGLMLQGALVAKAGLPSPYVTSELVEQYYQGHKDTYGELPTDPTQREAAWQTIDTEIRQTLSPEIQAQYQEKLRQFLVQIKASAKITLAANAD